jgi:hypothetical protein
MADTSMPVPVKKKKQVPAKQEKAKGMQVPEGVKFYYLGRPGKQGSRNHNGVVTIAVKPEHHKLKLGFSFCSPADNYLKLLGRDIALTRLENDPFVIPYVYDHESMARQVIKGVLSHDFKSLLAGGINNAPVSYDVPSWTKKKKKPVANILAEIRLTILNI